MKTKICRRCNEEKPANYQYFYKNKQNVKDGLHTLCKECKKTQVKEYQHKRPKPKKTYKILNPEDTWMNGHDEIYL